MEKQKKAFALLVAAMAVGSSALAQDGGNINIPPMPGWFKEPPDNLTRQAETLRKLSYDQQKEGRLEEAAKSISDSVDIMQNPKYTSVTKSLTQDQVLAQMTAIAMAAYDKKNWALTEQMCRKKMDFMEKEKLSDDGIHDNDYQGVLSILELALRAQNKSTEMDTLKSKIKPLIAKPNKSNYSKDLKAPQPEPAK